MKKLLALLLSMVLLTFSACGGSDNTETSADINDTTFGTEQQTTETEISEQTETTETPSEFTVAAGDDQIYTDLTFDNDITILLDTSGTVENRSQILFGGCTFNGNIKVIGDRSAFIRFTDGCVFGENCQITVIEATEGTATTMTLEDDFIKLLFTDPGVVVNAEAVCNVLCMNGEGVIVDGIEYLQTDFPDNTGFCVATYYENGEKQIFTLGVDE